ncbi:hypothetical protein F7725_014101 [Dissostichus mawsoni]|uniref:Uncharacterized protein n=1 Tax=Dissostichus mawsoni TaxID=36200 RepID=A0A7J5YW49_DISMA|nr:hypothetical protein F7725_014101 [Dissostichus mawsoni]
MDEDLTGISEMLKTPAADKKKKRSVINENNALKTPVGALGASVVEPSMMVSPLTVSSSVKGRSYNSEAVQRLLNDEDEESKPEAVEDIKVELLTTLNEKVEQQDSIAIVEVVCETPQKEAEPIEDLQENVLETPKAPEAEATRVDDVEETAETPVQESEEPSETTDMLSASSGAPAELEDLTQDETVDYTCCEVKAKEPQDDAIRCKDVPEVNMEKADANDVVVDDIESSDAAKMSLKPL